MNMNPTKFEQNTQQWQPGTGAAVERVGSKDSGNKWPTRCRFGTISNHRTSMAAIHIKSSNHQTPCSVTVWHLIGLVGTFRDPFWRPRRPDYCSRH